MKHKKNAGSTGHLRRHRSAPRPKSRPEQEEIVYTQPKPFHRNRFLLQMATVAAVVLALVFGLSIFFKVERVEVSGMFYYSAWEIREATGIQDGENLLGINEAKISGNILSQLPHVAKVRVGIKLPNTVNIEITELKIDELFAMQDQDASWWLVTAEGKVVQQIQTVAAGQYTAISGVELANPVVGEVAVAVEPEPPAEGEQEPATMVPGKDRLAIALQIAGLLETERISGKTASIQVADTGRLEFWYEDRFQVSLGNEQQLSYKIHAAAMAISQMAEYQSGTLDVSFTTWPDKVGYIPFS